MSASLLHNLSLPRAVMEVSLPAVKSNCRLLQELSQGQFFCPMVKDDAYGHGVIPITQTLMAADVKQVGVISVTEAWQIQEFVSDPPDVLIFGPVLNKEDWQWLENQTNCLPVINNWLDLEKAAEIKTPFKIHLKFDTGFTRLGFSLAEANKIKSFLKDAPFLQVEGLCTQLLSTENNHKEKQAFIGQIKILESLFAIKYSHCLNTETLISLFIHNSPISSGARPGIGLYGIKTPIPNQNIKAKKKWEQLSLKSASTLKSYIVNIHQLKKGGKVSYSGTWTAPRDSTIATVSLGYGDGFSRSFSNKGQVLYRGKRVPLAGRVCMDFFMIDVTDISEKAPYIGEEIVIFGHQGDSVLSVSEQAACIDTIPYEMFTSLGDRIKRKYDI